MAADLDVDAELSPAGMLRGLHHFIDRLHTLDMATLASAELIMVVRDVERAARRLPAVRNEAVAELEEQGIPAAHGCRSAAALLRQLVNCSAAEAGSWLAQADDLVGGRSLSTGEPLPARLPALARAVAAGDVSAEQVRVVRRAMAGIPAAVDEPTRVAAEQKLVDHARTMDSAQLSQVAARLLACLDPDGALGSTDRERQLRRGFAIGRQDQHGMYPVTGLLDPETGALLNAALEPLAAPRHTPEERDDRTRAQRMHDAVRDAAKMLLSGDLLPSQSGVPATLLLTATLDQIEQRSGLVSTAHGGQLPVDDVIRLAAQAHAVPIVFDTDGAPLWLGRSRRLASLHQRLALIVMDKGCIYPGCDVPAIRCEVMHLHDWIHGGPTDIDRLALGCDYHHHRLTDWRLQRRGGRIWCIPPPWIDPDQKPRLNTTFHDPELEVPLQ